VKCVPEACAACAADLADAAVTSVHRRQVFEAAPAPPPTVTDYRVVAKVCRVVAVKASQTGGHPRAPAWSCCQSALSSAYSTAPNWSPSSVRGTGCPDSAWLDNGRVIDAGPDRFRELLSRRWVSCRRPRVGDVQRRGDRIRCAGSCTGMIRVYNFPAGVPGAASAVVNSVPKIDLGTLFTHAERWDRASAA
jgi:hypothetical protein